MCCVLADFTLIDAHSHLPLDDPSSSQMLERLGIAVLNICVDSPELGGLDAQRDWYRELRRRQPQRFAWCTSFSLDGFGSPGWTDRAIDTLEADFAAGAISCKVWKNVGMGLRDPQTGQFVFVDDERFLPVFDHVERGGRPVLMHIGEPLACWRALDPESPHYAYYKQNRQWHWHGRRDVPSHEALMDARDRVIARHPGLIVVGAHYGSHEADLQQLSRRFDQFDNFFVDTSARLGDLAVLTRDDRECVRDFFIRHADRILWGVDWVLTTPASRLTADAKQALVSRLTSQYELEWRFFTTRDELLINNRPVRGLGLPAMVISRLFSANAIRVYQGLFDS
jgi:hypothetical protein